MIAENPMRKVRIEKVVIHSCVGKSGEALEKASKIIEKISGQKPAIKKAKKTIRDFGIHKREPISVMVTLRGRKAEEVFDKVLKAVDNKVKISSLDNQGNLAFGIEEHIDIPEMKYDPDLGVIGLDVIACLERPGYRVKRRRREKRKIPKKHRITREEAINFFNERFGVEFIQSVAP